MRPAPERPDLDSDDETRGPTGVRVDGRLLPLAGAAWGAAGFGVLLAPSDAAWTAAGCLVGAAASVAAGRRLTRAAAAWRLLTVQLALMLATAAAALLSCAGQNHARLAGVAEPLVRASATVTVTGTIRAPPRPVAATRDGAAPRWVIRVDAESMRGRAMQGPVQTPLLVIGNDAWSTLMPGQQIEVTGSLRAAEPGDTVVALVRPVRPPEILHEPSRRHQLQELIRARLRQACAILPDDPRGLLPGLVVGDTSELPNDLADAMRTTGLTHLTAVSGANITIVAGSVLFALTAAGVRRLVRLAGAGVAVLAFVGVAGPEPSVLRAATMGCVGLLGLAVARPGAGLPPLCLAVTLLALVDPWLARSPGFALSVLATAGLLLGANPLARQLERVMPRWLALATAVPLAAQAAVGPVVILLQPAVPMYALPANMLVAPAVAPVTVLGALAGVVAPVSLPLASVLVWLAGWPLRWICLTARTGATLPGASLPWPAGITGALSFTLLTIVALAALIVVVHLVPTPTPTPTPLSPGGRPTGAASVAALVSNLGPRTVVVVAAAVVLILAALLVALPRVLVWVRPWPPDGWRVVACDVGQGTGVVMATGPGSALVIDTGPDPDQMDRCLTRLGIRRIDLLVLTHFHADHVDGLPGALRSRQVNQAWVTGLAEPAAQARAALADLAEAGVPVLTPQPGSGGRIGHAEYRVLGPNQAPPHAESSATGPEGSEANNASLILWVRVDGVSVLSLGDAEPDAQADLRRTLAREPTGPVDVVVVAHHGSAKQDPALYALAQPRVGLISVGADNDYGHPAPSLLTMLDRLSVTVARTDTCGDTAVVDSDPGPDIMLATTCASAQRSPP